MLNRFFLAILPLIFSISVATRCCAQSEPKNHPGQLIMIGGGLGVSNKPVFLDLIMAAGGTEQARFVLLPTANLSNESAHHFRKELEEFGVPGNQVEVLDVLHTNASTSTKDPGNVKKIDSATAVYMTGGDQVRLVRALTNSDGSDTPVLAAMRRLYARGGVIAGTSAGASALGTRMLAASGLPSMLIDEGLDALDYGLTTDSMARGVLVTKGLGFVDGGVIDQHFLQYRGRLGRLSRVTLEHRCMYGIGIDRDSAVRSDRDGKCIVTGGRVIVIVPGDASFQDGPLGFAMNRMRISLLSLGDYFDPSNLSTHIHPSKHEIAEGELTFNGGFLITDIGSGYAIASALIGGLAENAQTSQDGIVLKFHDDTSHGYRYHFRKVPATKSYHADSLDGSLYSVINVQLAVEPIANGLHKSSTQSPVDIGDLPAGSQNEVRAVAFRGLLPTNAQLEFRPNEMVTRREFAVACVRSVHLHAPSKKQMANGEHENGRDIEYDQALEAGFVTPDGNARLDNHLPISIGEVKVGLDLLAARCAASRSAAYRAKLDQLLASQPSSITRGQLATLLTQLLFPQWSRP